LLPVLPTRSPIGPDRKEAINPVIAAARVEIERGVLLRPLVGHHNQARGLTTGIVTFLPGGQLPYHLHPFAESVTVLQGRLEIEVEGRRYALGPLDNITINRETPHHSVNPSKSQPAVAHIAMASANVSRKLVEEKFISRQMPADATGTPGRERFNRHATT